MVLGTRYLVLVTHFVGVAVTEQELVFPAAEALRKCEAAIEGYRLARDVAGKALVEIHDQELYRAAKCGDFLAYCAQRWQLQRSAAYALMDLGRFARAAENSGVPEKSMPTEKQLRVLKSIKGYGDGGDNPWRRRVEAWEIVSSQRGADIESRELKAELVQQRFVPPRARRKELTPEQQRERERCRRLAPLERWFGKIVTYMAPEEAGEQLGPVSDWKWLTQLEDWLERMREVSS